MSEIEKPIISLIDDQTDPNFVYIWKAMAWSPENENVWQIKRIDKLWIKKVLRANWSWQFNQKWSVQWMSCWMDSRCKLVLDDWYKPCNKDYRCSKWNLSDSTTSRDRSAIPSSMDSWMILWYRRFYCNSLRYSRYSSFRQWYIYWNHHTYHRSGARYIGSSDSRWYSR